MQLVIQLKPGMTPADIAGVLRFQAAIFDGEAPKEAAKIEVTHPKTKKAAAPKVEEETLDPQIEESFAEEGFEDLEDKPKKSAAKKAPVKFTIKDVNEACKAKMLKTNRAEVLGILKSKFKVASITELTEDQFGAVIKALA